MTTSAVTFVRVRLYVAGASPNSETALLAINALIREFATALTVEVIDVLEEPERALRDGVVLTPMLVKTAPGPERRLLGRLSDRAALVRLLGLEVAS